MRNDRDTSVIERMIKYCEDVEVLLERFDRSFDNYTNDISFQYSCNMCIIQIGELVGRLSEEFIDANNDIPWHAIKAMRNLHAHDYDNADLDIVWNTLTTEIPELKTQLEQLL